MNAEIRLGIARLALTALLLFCLGGEWMSTQRPPILPVSQEELRGLGFPFPPRAVFIDGYDLVPIRRTDILAFRFRLPAEDFPAFLRSLGFPEFRIADFDAPCQKGEPIPEMFQFDAKLRLIPGWPTEEEVRAQPERFFSCIDRPSVPTHPITRHVILVDRQDPRVYRVYVVWWNRVR
jgi:hypothetical protein